MKESFFELLSYDNTLKRQHKYLKDENPEEFEIFLKFLVTIKENLHYSEREEYINLAKTFLNNQISADDFSYSFLSIYEGICKKITELKTEESVELASFLNNVDRSELNRLLAKIYGSCDQKELKDYANILLLKLEE
jgi:Bacterial self-protective colicin-like immunity